MTKRYTNARGEVGVLYSPGFGAGWSTWADEKLREFLLFDPTLVLMALDAASYEEVEAYVATQFGEDVYFYARGWNNIAVKWMKPGTEFIINEYDGSESFEYPEDHRQWRIA